MPRSIDDFDVFQSAEEQYHEDTLELDRWRDSSDEYDDWLTLQRLAWDSTDAAELLSDQLDSDADYSDCPW